MDNEKMAHLANSQHEMRGDYNKRQISYDILKITIAVANIHFQLTISKLLPTYVVLSLLVEFNSAFLLLILWLRQVEKAKIGERLWIGWIESFVGQLRSLVNSVRWSSEHQRHSHS
ncbi:hypothetical protein T12_7461 [Trichinella patagoniensis]|uniref:Uncharacterized protein n=1 Tax=Trichinella patagoniensis TaxID=990121 RepID=A0A0V0ZAD3_9BILA|nr:hypothetical protein T12_7461 [Trichinella patagoniensis]